MQSTFKPAMLLTSGRAVAFVATFMIPVVLARAFNPAEFGTYKQVFLIYMTLAVVAQFGMAECLYYFMPRNPSKSGEYLANSALALTGMGALCLTLLVFGRHWIGGLLNNAELSAYMPELGVYFLLMMSSSALEITMIAKKRFGLATISYASSDILRAVLSIVPVFVFRTLNGLMIGAILQASVRCLALLVYLWRDFRQELRLDWTCLKEQLHYSIPFGLAVLAEIFQANLHQYVVSHYFDAATFAVYSVGCLQVPLVDFVATPMGTVMMVRLTEEIREGLSDGALAIWHDAVRKLSLIFFPLVGLLVVNAHNLIVVLFSERYVQSVPIFMVWSLDILFAAFPTEGVLRVFAETRFQLAVNLVKLATVAALIGWCLNVFHLQGAVIVTLSSIAGAKVLSLWRIKRLMSTSVRGLMPWSNLAATLGIAAAACCPALIVRSVAGGATLLSLGAVSSAYLLSYAGLGLVFGVLNDDEKRAIVSVFKRVNVECVESQE